MRCKAYCGPTAAFLKIGQGFASFILGINFSFRLGLGLLGFPAPSTRGTCKFLFRRPPLQVRNPSKAHARAELFPFGLGLGTRKGVRFIDEEGRTGGSRDGKGLL